MIGLIQYSREPSLVGFLFSYRYFFPHRVLQEPVRIISCGHIVAVEADEIVTFFDIDSLFGQGRPCAFVPVLPLVDFADDVPVGFFIGPKLSTQKPAVDPLDPRKISPVDVAVAGVQFSDQLAKNKIKVSSVTEIGDKLAVFFLHFLPVHSVHVLHVEPIPVYPPAVLKDLPPFLERVDFHR